MRKKITIRRDWGKNEEEKGARRIRCWKRRGKKRTGRRKEEKN